MTRVSGGSARRVPCFTAPRPRSTPAAIVKRHKCMHHQVPKVVHGEDRITQVPKL